MVISNRFGTMGESIMKGSLHVAYMKEDGYESSDNSVSSISSSTSDLIDDPTSSSYSSSSSSDSYNSQADSNSSSLSEQPSLMADQLPIKRGLSKFYQGKSESFTSLSDVTCIEDLAKKDNPYKRKMMKACKSYAGALEDLDGTVDSFCFGPEKKSSRNSFDSLAKNRRCSSVNFFGNKLPPFPLKKN